MPLLPTQRTPPKHDLADLNALIYGPGKIGKCLQGDTTLIDPGTGRPRTIRELVQSQRGSIYTMGEAGRIYPAEPSAFLEHAPEQLFRLTTQTGRAIEATARHPFLTKSGWKALGELQVSDGVAVVAEHRPSHDSRRKAAETQPGRLGPVVFDAIRGIEATTVEPVYDLTIPGTHNFIANDFVVHNSTWCAQAEDALFLATEAGLNHLEVFQVPITRWEDLLLAGREIAEGRHPFRTLVLDTVDQAYRMCAEYICAKLKIDHESDLGFGKGYATVSNEFQRVVNKLSLLPSGLFLVSHAQEREIETRTGKYTRMVPTLPEKARKIVLGMADLILYCDLETAPGPDGEPVTRRVMRTKPSLYFEAGDRTGRLPATIDLDYHAFVAAFKAASPCPAMSGFGDPINPQGDAR